MTLIPAVHLSTTHLAGNRATALYLSHKRTKHLWNCTEKLTKQVEQKPFCQNFMRVTRGKRRARRSGGPDFPIPRGGKTSTNAGTVPVGASRRTDSVSYRQLHVSDAAHYRVACNGGESNTRTNVASENFVPSSGCVTRRLTTDVATHTIRHIRIALESNDCSTTMVSIF